MLGHQAALERVPLLACHRGHIKRVRDRLLILLLLQLAAVDQGHVVAGCLSDVRHSSITNAAAAGTPPAALMSRAGHTDFKTTQLYIDLAGETFREEADRLERRLWGETVSS